MIKCPVFLEPTADVCHEKAAARGCREEAVAGGLPGRGCCKEAAAMRLSRRDCHADDCGAALQGSGLPCICLGLGRLRIRCAAKKLPRGSCREEIATNHLREKLPDKLPRTKLRISCSERLSLSGLPGRCCPEEFAAVKLPEWH